MARGVLFTFYLYVIKSIYSQNDCLYFEEYCHPFLPSHCDLILCAYCSIDSTDDIRKRKGIRFEFEGMIHLIMITMTPLEYNPFLSWHLLEIFESFFSVNFGKIHLDLYSSHCFSFFC